MPLLAALSTSAIAEWTRVTKSVDAVTYLDPATIRKSGYFRRVWTVEDLKQRHPEGEMSRRVLYEFDCNEGKGRILSFSTHSESMARGSVLLSGSFHDDWEFVAPETVIDATFQFVCAK